VTRWLLLAIAVVSGAGLAVELGRDHVPEQVLLHFSLSYEGNIPTWLSSSLLLGCAIMAGLIAGEAATWRRHWWGMMIAFGWVSLDEAAEIHEHLGGLIGTHGLLYFDWVIPAMAVVLVLAAIYWPFLRALPRVTRNRMLLAAVIYVGGAAGMELPLGWWTERHGNTGLGYALIDWVEETMEMIGAAVALLALLSYRAERGRRR